MCACSETCLCGHFSEMFFQLACPPLRSESRPSGQRACDCCPDRRGSPAAMPAEGSSPPKSAGAAPLASQLPLSGRGTGGDLGVDGPPASWRPSSIRVSSVRHPGVRSAGLSGFMVPVMCRISQCSSDIRCSSDVPRCPLGVRPASQCTSDVPVFWCRQPSVKFDRLL